MFRSLVSGSIEGEVKCTQVRVTRDSIDTLRRISKELQNLQLRTPLFQIDEREFSKNQLLSSLHYNDEVFFHHSLNI